MIQSIGKGCGSKPAATLVPASKDRGASQETESGLTFQRCKGETLKAYLERIDVESNARIMECFRKNRRMSDRRRRWGELCKFDSSSGDFALWVLLYTWLQIFNFVLVLYSKTASFNPWTEDSSHLWDQNVYYQL